MRFVITLFLWTLIASIPSEGDDAVGSEIKIKTATSVTLGGQRIDLDPGQAVKLLKLQDKTAIVSFTAKDGTPLIVSISADVLDLAPAPTPKPSGDKVTAPVVENTASPAPAKVESVSNSALPPATGSHLDALTDAANTGNAQAMVRLGDVYRTGDRGVALDQGKAFGWYLKAAGLGSPLGMYYAGTAFEVGWEGVGKDPQ
jgi:hypothetical protein